MVDEKEEAVEKKELTPEEIQAQIQSFVTDISTVIEKHENMKARNFALYCQHGRLGYVDLDQFAKSINAEALLKKANKKKSKKSLDKKKKK